jgi:hypothetical protein
MRKITLPISDTVKKALPTRKAGAVTHWYLFDSPAALGDYAAEGKNLETGRDSWSGNKTGAEAVHCCHQGDLAGVSASDALLASFERFSFVSSRAQWQDSFVGAAPNVPAYIAGQPLAMRQRIKVPHAAAPLAVIVDLTTSAIIDAETIARRGAAILALVRMLAGRRPVELWAGCCMDAQGGDNAFGAYARIDTAPLDLARAAFVLTNPAFSRGLCYKIGYAREGFCGHWPFNNHQISRTHMADLILPAMPHVTDALCIPPAHADDDLSKNPEGWVLGKLEALEASAAA